MRLCLIYFIVISLGVCIYGAHHDILNQRNPQVDKRSISNSITTSEQELRKILSKGLARRQQHKVPIKLYYYSHPLEEFRFEYQPLVRQVNDYEPLLFNPALWRANHGYGFNEWGSQGP